MLSPLAVRPLHALTPSEARSLTAFVHPGAEAQRLEKILTPAGPEEVAEAIEFLFKVLPMENRGETEDEKDEIADAVLAAFGEALRGYPRWAIIEARSAFIAGKVKGFNGRFAPSPPELGRECAARVDDYREKLGRMRRQADERRALDEEAGYGPLGPAARALGERRIAELRASADEKRRSLGRSAPAWIDPNPITPAMLEGVPDAEPRGAGMAKMRVPDEFKKLKGSRA